MSRSKWKTTLLGAELFKKYSKQTSFIQAKVKRATIITKDLEGKLISIPTGAGAMDIKVNPTMLSHAAGSFVTTRRKKNSSKMKF